METDQNQPVATIQQKFFSLRQQFTLTFDNPANGLNVVLLAVAIARVEAEEDSSNSASNAATNASMNM